LFCVAVVTGCRDTITSEAPPQRRLGGEPGLADSTRELDASVPSAGAGSTDTSFAGSAPRAADRVLLVSVDGLGASWLKTQLGAGKLPNFARLRERGASTLNARNDCDYTVTLPNHTTILTGRPVWQDDQLPKTVYHGWTLNGFAGTDTTLHNSGNSNLAYVASVFDVAHDHGKKTCMYAGKQKFSIFSNSYSAKYGAPDRVGEDNGRNKLDRVVIIENNTELLVATAEADFAAGVCDFAFLHVAELDYIGHSYSWGGETWNAELDRVDAWLGRLMNQTTAGDAGSVSWGLVVTADHGGVGTDHSDTTEPFNYRIPFFVVGPGVPPNRDLYEVVGGRRKDPGSAQLRYSAPDQPVRNADAPNVALRMLGLPNVPGSFMRNLLVAE
jgi:hypothetical protein